jgi:phage-related protein (TIGR01555 family)
VLDRWDLQIAKKYSDPLKPKYGEPEIYAITTSSITLGDGGSYGAQVHESRVIRFDGVITKKRRMAENDGWSESVLQRTYDTIRDFVASYQGTANMLQDFSQAVFKIKNLSNMLASDQDSLILKRLALMDQARSVARAVPLDADGEEFERKATPTTGLPELLDRMGTRLSTACGIPIAILLGESPGGMNATGDSDHRSFNNTIRSQQESVLRPAVSRLITLLATARNLDIGDDETGEISFSFRPLWQQSEQEIADTRLKVAQTDQIYITQGVLDAAEVGVSRFGGDRYSMDTTIDTDEQEAQSAPVDPKSSDLADKPTDALAVDAGTALNGAQVTAMVDIVTKVASGLLPRDSGVAILVSAFPVDEAGAEKIMGSAGKSFKIEQPAQFTPGVTNTAG